MRTLLILLFIGHCSLSSMAQVTLDILSPGVLRGSYEHTWAEPSAGSWNTPDMMQPSNRITGTLALALDGTASDSLVCASIADPALLAGKIALLYRGTCDYSEKAKFCQNAGAVAVIIINNIPGPPVGMGAGAIGQQVMIPVFQIGMEDGVLLRDELDAGGSVTALLGNKNGYFASDLGLNKYGVLLPPSFARPSLLTAAPGEHVVRVAAWAHNFGTQAKNGAVLRATVTKNGSMLYDHSSAAFSIAPGDSAFITLPDFVQNSYDGRYILSYGLAFPGTDEHEADNRISIPMVFDSLYSLVPLDVSTSIPITTIGIQPATPGGEYESCIHFRDDHASRAAVTGLHLYAAKNAPGVIDGEPITIRIYEWVDLFSGLSDPSFTISSLVELATAEYFLEAEADEQEHTTFLPFEAPVVLMDQARYLFCASTFNTDVFLGYNRDVHYATHQQVYDQPVSPNRTGNSWFVGFTGGPVSSIAAHMIDVATIGMNEHEQTSPIVPYPNPSAGNIQITLDGIGPYELTVYDAAGRTIRQYRSSASLFMLDLGDEGRGLYTIKVQHAQGVSIGRVVLN